MRQLLARLMLGRKWPEVSALYTLLALAALAALGLPLPDDYREMEGPLNQMVKSVGDTLAYLLLVWKYVQEQTRLGPPVPAAPPEGETRVG